MLVVLLFMTCLFADRFGQRFIVDQARIPPDPAEVAGRSLHRSLEHPARQRPRQIGGGGSR
jgi:hypothetical protein